MGEFIIDTPRGPLHSGDTIWYRRTFRRRGERLVGIEQGVVSSRSYASPTAVFARNTKNRPRCVPIDDITRIDRKDRRSD